MGRRWDSSRPAFFTAIEGLSLESIVLQSIESAYKDKVYSKTQRHILLKYARCRWNGMEVAREHWKDVFPQKGDRIEVLHGVRGGGGGGGGGKNPIATVLSVLVVAVAAAATWWAGGAGVTIPLGLTAAQFTTGVALVSTGMLMAINMLFPAKQPSVGGIGSSGNAEKESPTYSINGGKNAHNVDGYVPLVLGRHRQTPPLGAKSWTMWQGEDQYFNMLVVWGHADVVVSDFKIGDTALSKFEDVTHVFHQSTTGKGLKYFGWQYNEESVGATLDTDWTVRTVGEGTALSVDVEFPGGLCVVNKNNGNKEKRTIQIDVQYKTTAGGTWKGFPTKVDKSFGSKTLEYTQEELNNTASVFYKSGKLYAVPRGQTVSGGVQFWPRDGLEYCYGCGVTCTPNGTKMKVEVAPGVFKKGGKVYSVGGAKLASGYTIDYNEWSTWHIPYATARGGSTTTLTIDSPITIGVSEAGSVHKGSGFRNLWPSKSSGVSGGSVAWKAGIRNHWGGWEYDEYQTWQVWNATRIWHAEVASGSFSVSGSGRASISGSKQKQTVRNFQITGLPLSSYDVRIRRVTKRTDDSYIIDDCQWSTMRAIIQKAAFDTPVPICVSELRIRASEQLSGYVTEFSGMCVSKIPDWTPQTTKKVNGKTVTVPGHWNTWRETSNPASIMRYLLTSRHSLINPFKASRLDNNALVALWNWCKKNDYRFDFIADSEENLWARLVQVLSPAMAGPTTDVDGLWGAIIDQPNKTVRQMFTPRNSWGMSIQRGFARLPDALRVKFIDETDDYVQKEGFVYNDGFNKDGSGGKKKANDVVEWSFEGVTNWNRMYKLARYHLAQLLHRQMNITINTDWEWLAVHRGDLVGLSSDVLMNTFGTARIMRKVYQGSGKVDGAGSAFIYEDNLNKTDKDNVTEIVGPGESVPSGATLIGVQLDDTIYYTSPKPARYGLAIRNATGKVSIIEITPQYGLESDIVYFANRTQASKAAPNFGDLVSVSLLGSEYEEYLVSSITPGENMSAQITLVPYKTAEIMKAANGKIPAYEAPVILDAVKGAQDLPTPSLKSCISNEAVAQLTASGAVVVCIGATWSIPPTSENLAYFTIELNATREDNGATISGTSTNAEEYAVARNAVVGKKYFCKIRIHDPATGRTSAWSNIVTHTVAGLVMPPPAPQNVKASTVYPKGVMLTWDEVQVIDLRRYKVTGSTTGQTRGKETEYVYEPRGQSGKLTYNVWAVDTTDHVSKAAGTASITIIPPKKPTIQVARLENDGVVLQYATAEATWPIVQYEVACLDKTAHSTTLRAVVGHPNAFEAGETTAKMRAKDYFGNWGAWSDGVKVAVVPPLKPTITLDVNDAGIAMFQWGSCRTYTDIRHYVVTGDAAGNGKEVVKTSDLSVAVDLRKVQNDEDIYVIEAYVYAVDKWGIEGPTGHISVRVTQPAVPVIRIERRVDGLHLRWQDCKKTFRISHYVVTDYAGGDNDSVLEILVDGTSQALRPRAAGEYTFSVKAVDVAGYESYPGTATFQLGGVDRINPKVKVDGSDLVVYWDAPSTSWPIETYIVKSFMLNQELEIGRCDATSFRFPAPKEGSYEYGVIGKDVADNYSQMGVKAAITIRRPVAPTVEARLDGGGMTITWKEGTPDSGESTLPIVAWDVNHWYDYDNDGDGVASECNQDLGRLDVNTTTVPADSEGILVDSLRKVPALPKGRHFLYVRGIDSAGNVGDWGDGYIDIAPPGKVTFQNCSVVDNNVMLYWSIPDKVYFPIEYYLFEEIERYEGNGETIEYRAEIGRIDALFAATFETQSGRYIYAITPVDVAGNKGTPNTIIMQVSQPPDFILYHDWDSNFSGGNPGSIGREQPNGGRTNFVLDGEGHMVGPFSDSTWQENLDVMASEKGADANSITWAQKIGWDWEWWLEPAQSSAQYIEIVDAGALIPSTVITVTIDSITLEGDPKFTCKIETSQDCETWLEVADDALQAHAGEFQYVRYTIGLTGGTVSISNINYKLDVKRKSDFGQVLSNASDNGDGYVNDSTTPMLKGTWVPFNVAFADVSSLPKPNVVAAYDKNGATISSLNNATQYTAYTVFEDVLYPEGFRVFVLDKNGNRVTATVDWSAFGV